MEAALAEWSGLLVRWLHLIAGVAWIGASFYFNWLENHLERTGRPEGIAGELWAVHGGGFYFVRKYAVAPPQLPERLHWFKWEAYSTWITGFLLLIVVYYHNAGTMMLGTAGVLAPWQAVALGLATLVVSWLVYDALCRQLGHRPGWLATLITVLLVLLAWGLSTLLSGRAAYIHVGAAVGTCMVANVFFVIIPSQKELVRAMEQGRAPDPRHGKAGLLRSRHNNYLTLPVLFIMISNHYPSTYAQEWNWAILAALSVISVAVRHYFNIRHRPGRSKALILPASALAFAAVAIAASPALHEPFTGGPNGPSAAVTEEVASAEIQGIIQSRCTACHAEEPSFAGYASPPAGVVLETPAEIRRQREAIARVAVDSDYMPLANITEMTEDERRRLGAWIAAAEQDP
ncbi:urate hydroxylase PuuD [Arhodomonas sp. SL1]|uniref:urate hydroxylase PuuD n=1 Tax=Arhodomonas sp. SL1 TaxID=3425691 RepID=UPI003F882270